MSTRIKAGETTFLRIPTNINMSAVDTVIFTLIGKRQFTKIYPKDVSYSNGEFLVPLTQQNTIDLQGTYRVEGQVNYGNKAVLITDIIEGCIEPSLSVKIISGSVPNTDITTPMLSIGGTVIVVSNGGGSSYTLPKASANVLGGIKIGSNLSIDNNGVVSATDTTYSDATTSESGLMSASDKAKLDGLSEDYSLPTASTSVLGGVKIDGSTITINDGVISANGGNSGVQIVNQTDTTKEIQPNVLNVWGEMASLNITLATPTDNTIVNEYMIQFTSGATATVLTLPNTLKWYQVPTIDVNKTYQISIQNGIGLVVGA